MNVDIMSCLVIVFFRLYNNTVELELFDFNGAGESNSEPLIDLLQQGF